MKVTTDDNKVADHAMNHHMVHIVEDAPPSNFSERTTDDINIVGKVDNENLHCTFTKVCLTNDSIFKFKYCFTKIPYTRITFRMLHQK